MPAESSGEKILLKLPSNLSAFSPGDKLQEAYVSALEQAQGGEHDNLNKRLRFYVRHQLAAYAIAKYPALDIAECGCWRGHSALMTARLAKDLGFKGRFSIFDSFEGLSAFQPEDLAQLPEQDEATLTKRRQQFRSDEEHVRRILNPFDFVEIYRGWIPTRFDAMPERVFSFVHIDVDLYQPTKDAVSFFLPKLASGGVLFVDDYGYLNFPGAKTAVDEILLETECQLFVALPQGGAFLVR